MTEECHIVPFCSVRGFPWWLWYTLAAHPWAKPTVVHDDEARIMLARVDGERLPDHRRSRARGAPGHGTQSIHHAGDAREWQRHTQVASKL